MESLTESLVAMDARTDPDEEIALEELMSAFGAPWEQFGGERGPLKSDEFVCSKCHLVMHRSRLASPRRRICVDCTVPVGGGRPAL